VEKIHDNANKSQHNLVFVCWLISVYSQKYLRSGMVYDIAGGLGLISFHLVVRFGIDSTLVEPRSTHLKGIHRRLMRKVHNNRIKLFSANVPTTDGSDQGACPVEPMPVSDVDKSPIMKLINATLNVKDDGVIHPRVDTCLQAKDESVLPYQHVKQSFSFTAPPGIPLRQKEEESEHSNSLLDMLKTSSVLVGMHSDGATEAIIDMALYLDIPFEVVPCCVFACDNPNRKLPDGSLITEYSDFLDYLQKKHPSIQRAALPFLGRNVVLYRLSAPK
jgi:hypothetical protein